MTRPLLRKMDQARRLDGSDSAKVLEIVERLRPREVYVYAMGQEPWLTFLTSIKYTPQSRPIVESDKLVAECRSRGLVAERLFGHKELLLDSVAEPEKVSAAYSFAEIALGRGQYRER
jgi:hypothetical protein